MPESLTNTNSSYQKRKNSLLGNILHPAFSGYILHINIQPLQLYLTAACPYLSSAFQPRTRLTSCLKLQTGFKQSFCIWKINQFLFFFSLFLFSLKLTILIPKCFLFVFLFFFKLNNKPSNSVQKGLLKEHVFSGQSTKMV